MKAERTDNRSRTLLAVVSIAALAVLVLMACGRQQAAETNTAPSTSAVTDAPASPDSATPTPASVATASPDTAIPTLSPGATSPPAHINPECTPAGEQTAIDTGQGTWYIDPQLWATLQHHANGASGLPPTVTVALGWNFPYEWDTFEADEEAAKITALNVIEEAGGVAIGEYEDVLSAIWQIPTENVLAVIQRPDVYYAEIPPPEGFDQRATATVEAVQAGPEWPPSEPLNPVMADIAKAYCLGVSAERAAQYALFIRGDAVATRIVTDNEDTRNRVLVWLNARNIYTPPDRGTREDHDVGVLLPVSEIDNLAQAFFPEIYLIGEDHQGQELPLNRSYWPADVKEFEDAVVSGFTEEFHATPSP